MHRSLEGEIMTSKTIIPVVRAVLAVAGQARAEWDRDEPILAEEQDSGAHFENPQDSSHTRPAGVA